MPSLPYGVKIYPNVVLNRHNIKQNYTARYDVIVQLTKVNNVKLFAPKSIGLMRIVLVMIVRYLEDGLVPPLINEDADKGLLPNEKRINRTVLPNRF